MLSRPAIYTRQWLMRACGYADCDGANNSAGLCANDPSGQGQTAFMDTVKNYGISDLNSNSKPSYPLLYPLVHFTVLGID